MLGSTLLIALLLSTAPSLLTVAFSQEAPVVLVDPTPAELCPSCTSVTFLIKPGKQSFDASVPPKVELVSLNGDRKDADGGFHAEWIDKPPRAIKIKIQRKDLVVRSGIYDVYLNLQPTSQSEPARLKVQILRPIPKILHIDKLIVNRTYKFPFLTPADNSPELFLEETSQKSNLTNLRFNKVGNASIGTQPIGGMLEFPPDQLKTITAGEHKKIEYTLKGDFDLGLATGSMRIMSNESIDPLGTLDFEIRSRVHWLYIGLTIAFGLFCSYCLKVLVQQRLELDQAKLDALKLVERVVTEEPRHADSAFAITYRPLLNELNKALTGTNPVDINNAKAALDIVWRKAVQDLAKRHQDQLDALDKLRDITNLDWPVPVTISTAILEARTAVAEIVTLIGYDDLTLADTQRRQAILNLGTTALQAALDWQSAQNQILNALRSNPKGISRAISTVLDKPAQDLVAALVKIGANTLVGTPEQIQQALSDVRSERLLVRQFVDFFKNRVQTELSTAQASINTANLPNWDSNRFAALPTEINRFIAFLDSTVDSPDPTKMGTHLNNVHLAWTEALQGQFSPSNNANVQINLDSHNYFEAVGTAIEEKSRVGPVALGLSAQAASFIAPAFLGYTSDAAAPSYYLRTRFQTLFTVSPTQPTSVTAEAQLKKDKLTQSLILSLMLIVAGYGLQQNTFVGTFTEFSTLFFWAFGLDLTVEAIRGAAKKN